MLGAIAPLAKVLFSTIEKAVPDKKLRRKVCDYIVDDKLVSVFLRYAATF